MQRICKDCGASFELGDSEMRFYESKGLELPKRCEKCRSARRNAKAAGGSKAETAPTASRSAGTAGGTLWHKVVAGIVAVAVVAGGGGYAISQNGTQGAGTTPQVQSVQQHDVAREDARPLVFRTDKQLKQHYDKHGKAMGFTSAAAYEKAAAAVVRDANALHKLEKEDGDDVYYLEKSDEIVFVSQKGYIRTYFNPGGKAYFDRQ